MANVTDDGQLPPRQVVELARRVSDDAGVRPRLIAHERVKKSVHRLRFEGPAAPVSVIVKRMPPRVARANQLVAERWLPAVGLEWACPRLRGAVDEPTGAAVWHIYDDIGGTGLDTGVPDPRHVVPFVELIVDLHTRFADHPLLAECRERSEDLGMRFYAVGVDHSVAYLESIGPPLRREHAVLKDRLLGRVQRLDDEREERALLHETCGGPETLLHGDLWPTNALVVRRADGLQPRLIDWDHVGVGSVTYDLSTFLYRFAPEHRVWILGCYRDAAARRGWRLPDDRTLNLLFETAEYARFACCLAEAALAASVGESWAFEQLAEIDTWFADLEPALRVRGG